jgi:Domain of unknown function (DUF4209)
MNSKTLGNFYTDLENIDWLKYNSYDNPIQEICKKYLEILVEQSENELFNLIQMELDISNFVLTNNELKPMRTSTDKDGNFTEYPSLRNVTEQQFEYIKKRVEATNNDYLKHRYSHILWLSPQKHLRYAKETISAYINLVKINFQKLEEEDIEGLGIIIYRQLINIVLIAQSSNCTRKEEIKTLIIDITGKIKPESQNKYLFSLLIKLIIENNKLFKSSDLIQFKDKIWNLLDQETSQHSKIDVAHLGLSFSIKTNGQQVPWLRVIAECYEKLSYEREDDTNLAAVNFASHSVDYYKKIKDKSKIKDLTKRYKYLKENMTLDGISQQIDITEIYKEFQRVSEKVLEGTSDDIFLYLMYSKDVIPSYDELYQQALKQKINNPITFQIGKSIIDNLGHTAEYFNDEDEIIRYLMLEDMNRFIEHQILFIQMILFEGIKTNKLNIKTFIEFLKRNSWLGQNIKRTYTQGQVEEYSLLSLIIPAINDYFSQIDYYFINNNNIPNFILSIDSLSLKIEGIFRNICEISNGTTFFFVKDKKNRNIVREKDINLLFHEEEITKLFSKDDLFFLRFILVEKAGLNIRNKVAHSLFKYTNNYNLHLIHLLIIAILIIAKNEYAPLATRVCS